MTRPASDITAFSNPILFDKIAADLNVKLATLTYIDDMYTVCSIGYEEEESFPEIYTNNGSKLNLRVMPNTDRAMSFFFVTGEMVELDDFYLDIPMALIVWFNIEAAFPSANYDKTSEVIRDVSNLLREYGCTDITVDINDVFSPFTMLEKQVATNTMRPYSGAKFTFNKTAQICEG